MFGKHAWMCSICGQGLTRKSSATRHNNNLHLGQAVIVRPIEYVIRSSLHHAILCHLDAIILVTMIKEEE